MADRVFFEFSLGLSGPLQVPAGYTQEAIEYVQELEATLGIEREQYEDNPPHWKSPLTFAGVTDKLLCETATRHNQWVRKIYDDLATFSQHPERQYPETMTPEDAARFWPALRFIRVPPSKWTQEYYIRKMDYLFDIMTAADGRECASVTFDAPSVTSQQAGAVVTLFAEFLDRHDARLAVPRGNDFLCMPEDYYWCSKHGDTIYKDDISDYEDECAFCEIDCGARDEFLDDDGDK